MPSWGLDRGILDVYTNTADHGLDAQEAFKTCYDAFEHWVTLGYCTRVALFWGNDGSAGTGTDFHDDAIPFRSNAWFVYCFPPTQNRWYSYYVHVQYAEDGVFGSGPSSAGTPGLLSGGTGSGGPSGQFGFQVAIGVTSDGEPGNPWTGTTNFDGSDTKGATPGTGPVWAAPGGGSVHVFPRSNNTGGSHSTNKENHLRIYDAFGSYVDKRHDFVCDGDNIHVRFDFDDTGAAQSYLFIGPYNLRRDLKTSTALPFVVVHSDDSLGGATGLTVLTVGATTGTAFEDGGILYDHTVGVKSVALLSRGAGTSYTNNSLIYHNQGEELGPPLWPIYFSSEQSGFTGVVGRTWTERWGYMDSNVMSLDDVHPEDAPYSLRQWQWSTGDLWEFVFPYAGSALPKSTSTRAGRVI